MKSKLSLDSTVVEEMARHLYRQFQGHDPFPDFINGQGDLSWLGVAKEAIRLGAKLSAKSKKRSK